MSYLIKDTTEEERRRIAAHVTAVLKEWPICMTRISAAKWN